MDEKLVENTTVLTESASFEGNASCTDLSPRCLVSIKRSLLSPSFRLNQSYLRGENLRSDCHCASSEKSLTDDSQCAASSEKDCTNDSQSAPWVRNLDYSSTASETNDSQNSHGVCISDEREQYSSRKSQRLFRLSKTPYHPSNYVDNSPGPSCCDLKRENSQPSGSVLEIRRHQRRIRRRGHSDESCPVCGVTVRSPELRNHFDQEVRRLDTIPKNLKKLERKQCRSNKTFKQVKANREDRIKIPFKRGNIEMKCPGCLQNLDDNFENILLHISECVMQENEDNLLGDEDFIVDYDSSDEYTWAGDVRVRSTSLLRSVSDLPADLIKKTEENDIVEIIDSGDASYGPSQYSERDVIPSLSTTEDLSQSALREAVISAIATPNHEESRSLVVEVYDNDRNNDKRETNSTQICEAKCDIEKVLSDSGFEDSVPKNITPESLLIESLTRRIRELERSNNDETAKCHVCFGSYQTPLVSTTCWHVHCNDCWMKLLGEKKLCPQCSTITLPCNLRRVYI